MAQPSRAILMHSYADRYTHDFFFERDYPDVTVLDAIFAPLCGRAAWRKTALQKQLSGSTPTSSTKRWKSSGSTAAPWWTSPRTSAAASDDWRDSYIAQGEQKQAQIDQMIRYAESNRVPHVGPGAPLRRHRRRAEAVRHLRFLRARGVRRATVPRRPRDAERAALFRWWPRCARTV